MRKKRGHESVETTAKPRADETLLDVSASMQGTLRFDDAVNLRINGKFEGTLDTKGVLTIGPKADINANITGETISIAGVVKGNIIATKILTLDPTSKLEGDIDTSKIVIKEGAWLNGQIRMTQQRSDLSAQSSRGDWLTVNQLAKYLEVDASKISEWANGGMLPGTKEGGDWVFDRTKVDQWITEGKVKV